MRTAGSLDACAWVTSRLSRDSGEWLSARAERLGWDLPLPRVDDLMQVGAGDTPERGGRGAAISTIEEERDRRTNTEIRCPRSSSWSARAARTRSARPRLLPSRGAPSGAAC